MVKLESAENRICPCSGFKRTLLGVGLALVAALLVMGCGEKPPGKFRVGILCGLDVLTSTLDGFLAKMTELGYVEGRNIVYDLQGTNFDTVAEQRILERFIRDQVDVILVLPTEVAQMAKRLTRDTGIPVVFCQSNVEGTALVDSISVPGGNMTGVRYPGPDLARKRFEILNELAPEARRVWVPYTRQASIVRSQLEALRPAAARARVTLVETPAEIPADILGDLERREKAGDIGIDAVLFISEPLTRIPEVFLAICRFAKKHGLPVGGYLSALDGCSTIFGVGTDNIKAGELAALQVNKVLRGVPAGTIPVVSAEPFFQLNYTEAMNAGLKVPEGLLKQADQVIR